MTLRRSLEELKDVIVRQVATCDHRLNQGGRTLVSDGGLVNADEIEALARVRAKRDALTYNLRVLEEALKVGDNLLRQQVHDGLDALLTRLKSATHSSSGELYGTKRSVGATLSHIAVAEAVTATIDFAGDLNWRLGQDD